jgi:hypothetical protein
VQLTHRDAERSAWLTAQLVAVLVAMVLALPAMRRERGSVDDAADLDPDDLVSPDLPTRPILVGAPAEELVPVGADTSLPAEQPQDVPNTGRRAAGRGGAARRPGGHRANGRKARGRRKREGGES